MTTPKPKGAKSGDSRQPRLQDITRIEEKCDALSGKVDLLTELAVAGAKSPFAGLTFEQALCGLAFAMTSTQPGGTSADYIIAQRVKHAIRGLNAVITGDESLLQDKPKKHTRVEPSAVVTTVGETTQPVAAPEHSLAGAVSKRPSARP